MKINRWSGLVLTGILFLVVNCTEESADIYRSESPVFDATLVEIDTEFTKNSVNPVIQDSPNFPAVVQQKDQHTVEIKPLVKIDKADIFDKEQKISLKSGNDQPQLDLLFVIDDSNSMQPHQENLEKNMKKFVAALSTLGLLDYRIGVTATHDSRRYFNQVSEFKKLDPQSRNFLRMGRLFPVKTPSGLDNNQRFVTPANALVAMGTESTVLGETLSVGAKNYVELDGYQNNNSGELFDQESLNDLDPAFLTEFLKNNTLVKEAEGPRFEELLNPLVMATYPESLLVGPGKSKYRKFFPSGADSEGAPNTDDDKSWLSFAQSYNQNFIRKNAHLGIIVVTDTLDQSDEATGLTGEIAAGKIAKLKNDPDFENISTYGVLHKNSVSTKTHSTNLSEWANQHCTANQRTDDDVRYKGLYQGVTYPYLAEFGQLENFFNKTLSPGKSPGSNILNLCRENEGYGENLVRVATELFLKSVSKGSYDMDGIPVGDIQVFYQEKPTELIPVCETPEDEKVCWMTKVREGVRNIILRNQQALEFFELIVKYKTIDPKTATKYNSQKVGQ